RVMHDLEVPLALAGFQIDAHEAVAEQIVAGPVAAVLIGSRILNREVDEAEIFIDRDPSPDACVAIDGVGVVLPRLCTELAGSGNGVESPQRLAGLHIKRAHEALRVVVRDDLRAFLERGADDHHIFYDGRRRVEADLAFDEADLLAEPRVGAYFEIDNAVG